ncbi:MAG: pyridoxamine 5'-phosphate oxidase family protein [Kiritimatiellia bacterium]|nr:pyridoxamine 5'-phosphate oxidase family protein [Kiritimatiellia bacterium]
MQLSCVADDTLRSLLKIQPLAVLATQRGGRPYTSLVAFAASEDLRRIVFVTSRATTKYGNLSAEPYVSLLIDSRTHSVEDFTSGAAVTVLGRAAEIGEKHRSDLLEGFLRKHPHLETFARAPSTALCGVEVETYILVTQFQHVVEMKVSEWPSLNP